MPYLPYQDGKQGLSIFIRLTPKSAHNALENVFTGSDKQTRLKARVRAVPEKGKANKALIKLLAKSLDIPPSSLTLVQGDKHRNKTILVKGDKHHIKRNLECHLEGIEQDKQKT